MGSRVLKIIAIMIWAFLLLFIVMEIIDAPSAGGAAAQAGDKAFQCLDSHQSLVSGDRLPLSVPDSILSSESKNVSYIRSGRTEEDSAESVIFLIAVLSILSMYLFLLDGRPWSVIQSESMGFQEYFMRQLKILQSRDGKKERCSYSV